MKELFLTVLLTPPNLNHYVRHTRSGRHYVTKEAQTFKDVLAVVLRGRYVLATAFVVEIWIYLGAKQKGDCDGFPKIVLDGLARAGAFRMATSGGPEWLSDAHVDDLIVHKRRDRKNPRTEIKISGVEP